MIQVILDTDLGPDIDDHWAVAMLLGCPELDIRLTTTASGDTTYRAQLLAGLLETAGRTDIPIGIGPATPLALDEQGALTEAPEGRATRVAIGWRDLEGFYDHLVSRLEAAAAGGRRVEVTQ